MTLINVLFEKYLYSVVYALFCTVGEQYKTDHNSENKITNL